jgi:hypothetical protein
VKPDSTLQKLLRIAMDKKGLFLNDDVDGVDEI